MFDIYRELWALNVSPEYWKNAFSFLSFISNAIWLHRVMVQVRNNRNEKCTRMCKTANFVVVIVIFQVIWSVKRSSFSLFLLFSFILLGRLKFVQLIRYFFFFFATQEQIKWKMKRSERKDGHRSGDEIYTKNQTRMEKRKIRRKVMTQ